MLDAVEWGRAVHYTGARLVPRASARDSPEDHLVTLRQLRAAEFAAGWRAGPFPPPLPLFNPTKLILKGSKPRHVVDSSDPHDGTSVNANIDRSQTRLFNTSFAQLATLIVHEGPEAELIKFDVVSAYKLVRLLLQDLHLLGEQESFDGVPHSFSLATSFGSASSADNFHDLAEVIEFLIRLLATLLSSLARYADDFCGVVPRRTLHDRRPEAALEQIYAITHMLGVPIAKVEGPTTSLVFIGTAIDTVRMIAFIPPVKLAEAIAEFVLWQSTRRSRSGKSVTPARPCAWWRDELLGRCAGGPTAPPA